MKITEQNTLVLPEKLLREAPNYWNKKQLWFNNEPHEWRVDCDINNALIAEGIGERKCPIIAEWVAFSIIGAVVAKLTGKYIVPPKPFPGWTSDIEHHIWETLWKAAQENETGLDRAFMASVMRSFIPQYHHAPPDRPYCRSNFVSYWMLGEFPDTFSHSVSHVRLDRINSGRETIARLPQTMADCIKEVAQHVPPMLEISIERIKRTYMW